jgi:hypothetical protein
MAFQGVSRRVAAFLAIVALTLVVALGSASFAAAQDDGTPAAVGGDTTSLPDTGTGSTAVFQDATPPAVGGDTTNLPSTGTGSTSTDGDVNGLFYVLIGAGAVVAVAVTAQKAVHRA